MDVAGIITARGGSKGFPGKHLARLGGKPLIAWTIESALASRYLTRVIVSTDDEAIAGVSREFGADVPFLRPAELASDDTPHLPVVEHALDWLSAHGAAPEFCMLLQPTSPFRTADHIDAAIELAQATGAESVISVSEPDQHPFKIFGVAADGTLQAFIEPAAGYLRRQDLPVAHAENGAFYLIRCTKLRAARTFIPDGTRPYRMTADESVDIDTPADLRYAEWLLSEGVGAPR